MTRIAQASEEERQPLLASDDEAPQTTLPRAQIMVLCIMRVSEPVAFLCILPFIPKMLQDNMPGVPQEQIGYYAGFIESIFAIVQFATSFLWGRASDRIGRKPVLLIGLLGVGISMNFFGFAKTLPQMIAARSIAGLMNANISVLKTVLGELTDETNQARAFSLLPLCYAFGAMIGPAMGGVLSDPTEQFPALRDIAFLKTYPYWLPCFCASLFNVIGLVAGFFFLKETLPSKAATHDSPEEAQQNEVLITPPPPFRELLTPAVLYTLANSCFMNFCNISYISVLPLFCFTPIELGGLSLSKAQIGYYLAANGVVTIVVQLLAFPRLERKWGGPLPTLRRCLIVLPCVFLSFILAHYAGRVFGLPALIASLCFLLCLRGASSMMVVSSNLCVNNVVPHRAALGTINGLNQSGSSLARAIGPILATSGFAFSISRLRWFIDGQGVWILYATVSLITWWLSSRMRVPRQAAWRKT
jgi:MFS family permease